MKSSSLLIYSLRRIRAQWPRECELSVFCPDNTSASVRGNMLKLKRVRTTGEAANRYWFEMSPLCVTVCITKAPSSIEKCECFSHLHNGAPLLFGFISIASSLAWDCYTSHVFLRRFLSPRLVSKGNTDVTYEEMFQRCVSGSSHQPHV